MNWVKNKVYRHIHTQTHLFDELPKIKKAWLGNFDAYTKLASRETCKNHLIRFFNQKPQKFYTDKSIALPEEWPTIVDNNGQYLI